MKKVYIHAGPGKTGTSAIQYWLNRNKKYLKNNSIYYPGHEVDKNLISSGNLGSLFSRNGQGPLVFDDDKFTRLMHEFESSKCNILLLSSEFFFYKLDDLSKKIPEATYILYLRNPLELYDSEYNQLVKRNGKCEAMKSPKSTSFEVLDKLESLLSNNPNVSVDIRPYVSHLFKDRDIVTDLLYSLGFEVCLDKGSRINTSYTFEALEFKRFCNHFDLGYLEADLDRVLQSCQYGEKKYTFIEKEDYRIIKKGILNRIDAFSEIYPQFDLSDFKKHIKDKEYEGFKQQGFYEHGFKMVLQHLKRESRSCFRNLLSIISNNNNVVVPDSRFYKLFGVNFAEDGRSNVRDIENLFCELKKNKDFDYADLCRELGLLHEKRGDMMLAMEFMELAKHYRPNGPFINKKLESYRAYFNFHEKSSLMFGYKWLKWMKKKLKK